MIGWAKLKGSQAIYAHAWFYIEGSRGCWSACGIWRLRSKIGSEIDGTIPMRCPRCVRETKRDYKRKRGGAIY